MKTCISFISGTQKHWWPKYIAPLLTSIEWRQNLDISQNIYFVLQKKDSYTVLNYMKVNKLW